MRVHLVDGTWELFRAHYAPRPSHVAPSGKDLKATVGVVGSLLGLLADSEEAVTHLAVAFDNPIRSFRNDLFDGYKTDAGIEPALYAQFDDVERAVAALGVILGMTGERPGEVVRLRHERVLLVGETEPHMQPLANRPGREGQPEDHPQFLTRCEVTQLDPDDVAS